MDRPYVSQALPPHPSPLGCAEPCVSSPSHRAHSPAVCFTRAAVRLSMLLSLFVPPSPPLCVPKAALYEGHTVSVSLGSVVSAWPRAQRRCSGNKEGNWLLPCPGVWVSPVTAPFRGVSIASPSSSPSWEQAPGCFLPPRGPGVLGHSLPRSCHHLQALVGIDWGQSSHSDGERMLK